MNVLKLCTKLVLGLICLSTISFLNAQETPNIILIMTDDQGWGDVDFPQQLSPNPANPADQTYSGHPELKTPHLSVMASAGMKFNRFYAAAPVCSPTRASFLTGRHHRRTRVDTANNGRILNREITIAELAKTVGYNTGHFGKWHLGTLDKSVHSVDSNRGGTSRLPGAAANFSAPWNDGYDVVFATEAKTQTFNPTDLSPATHYWEGFEQSYALTDPTLDGDDSQVMMDRVIPFMLNAANNEQPFLATIWFHTPHKPFDVIDQGTLDEFYSVAEQVAMDNNERGYYACLTAMDKQLGRLRQELQNLNIADDTIIVFTSDNGPEDGVPGINGIAKGNLRGNKRDLFEGGVRVPTIVEWPGRIAPGSTTDSIGVVTDLLPTLVDLWGIDMPDNRPVDGESILPILFEPAAQRTGPILWDHLGLRSIVDSDGQYKAISTNSGSNWQLYDLVADPKETANLAISNPAVLNDLVAQWVAWRQDVDDQRAAEIDYRDYIVSTDNVTVDASSPASYLPNDLQSSTPIVVLEKQFFTLENSLAVDADGSVGTYDRENLPPGAMIGADEIVHSYLLHFAPPQASQTEFSISFGNDILGVVSSEDLLESSDFLAFANPSFFDTATGNLLRGLDFHDATESDAWTIMPDGRTLTVNMQSAANALDEIRVFTGVENSDIDPGSMPILVTSQADSRLLGFTTNSRDDNNGGGSANLIGLNTEGVNNFTFYEFDLQDLAGETTTGATVAVLSTTLNNANHGSNLDFIVLNELASTNVTFQTGNNLIGTNDNLTNDGSMSFLNRIQFNDAPGPAAGTTQPWLDEIGAPVANLLDAVTTVAAEPGFNQGESPVLVFNISETTAQRWIDDGLTGLVVSTLDNGDSRSRYSLLPSATIQFEIDDFLLGDVNCDGVVNLLDVAPFIASVSTGQFDPKADVNQDGSVDLLDVTPFVLLIGG